MEPPRRRGKETRPLLCRFSSGITPAWAGKSRPVSPPHRPHRDHPRMGGEKRQALSAAHGSAGSPPRGRGKACTARRRAALHGITPAWAGKSLRRCLVHRFPGDHPRVGGEKGAFCCRVPMIWGSPPRGRGKDRWAGNTIKRLGITPAWAGKSNVNHRPLHAGGDHPRVGGEKWTNAV